MKVALMLAGVAIGFYAFRARSQQAPTATRLPQALEYRGIITRVARQLKLDRTHVSRVAHGHRKSSKVVHALLVEIQRIERRAA